MIDIKKFLFLIIIFSVFSSYAYADGEIDNLIDTNIVKFSEIPENIEEIAKNKGTPSYEKGMYVIDSKTAEGLSDEIIEYSETNDELKLFEIPDDDYYSSQWQIQMVKPQAAWEFETYGNEVRVGVIDSGCSQHSELSDNLLTGFNYFNKSTDTTDNRGHGSHVSGIIASQMNGYGIVGVSPKAKIVPLKCFDPNKNTYDSMIVDAVLDAVDKYSCDVINMSFGGSGISPGIEDAINHATDKGAIVVAAVGNEGAPAINYPAGLNNVIGVGSVNENGTRSYFSNYNKSVFVVAPGEEVISLSNTKYNSYTLKSGTSMSTPIISGIAALTKSFYPDLTLTQFKNLLALSSDDLGTAGYDIEYGYGLANVDMLIKYLLTGNMCYVSPINKKGDYLTVLVYNNTTNLYINATGYFSTYTNERCESVFGRNIIVMPQNKIIYKEKITSENAKFFLWDNTLYPFSISRKYTK